MPTAEYVEAWSVQILNEHCNQKKFELVGTHHMAETFRSEHDGLETAKSLEQHVDILKQHYVANPDFHLEVLNSSSEVDEARGRATVYLFYQLTGLNNTAREAVALLKWERKQNGWLCVKHTGLRGPAGFA
ncbi:hypothetical protein LTR85_001727 [Meristemomyces frigidus]|nr:hypothetical protein LTR85_001727 [Meristemomyces frigidus]